MHALSVQSRWQLGFALPRSTPLAGRSVRAVPGNTRLIVDYPHDATLVLRTWVKKS